tara:strand:+ start:89 stop:826 length:738 start_codon:yes stop_codon:yes gene_type:complete
MLPNQNSANVSNVGAVYSLKIAKSCRSYKIFRIIEKNAFFSADFCEKFNCFCFCSDLLKFGSKTNLDLNHFLKTDLQELKNQNFKNFFFISFAVFHSYLKNYINNREYIMRKKENKKSVGFVYWINPFQSQEYHQTISKGLVNDADGYIPAMAIVDDSYYQDGVYYCSYPHQDDTLKLPWYWSNGFDEQELKKAELLAKQENISRGIDKLDVLNTINKVLEKDKHFKSMPDEYKALIMIRINENY